MSKIYKKKILIIGLGYVGLTLGLALANKGLKIWGYDKNKIIKKTLLDKKSHIFEKNINQILNKNLHKNFFLIDEINSSFDTYIITVGTPVNNKKANLTYIKEVTKKIARNIQNNPQLIYRSTLPIGTCNKVIIPILKKYNLDPGKDFDISFAPERTVEGNAIKELSSLPQIISGYNSVSIERCSKLFRNLTKKIFKVNDFETAEIVKLVNNSYRDLSFAYSNQIAMICSKYNLSANNVLKISNKDYPRNIIPIPSPGVGGPCLTKDPYILGNEIKTKKYNIFEIGRSINNKIVDELINVVKKNCKDYNEKILICGLSFKGYPETKDYRGSGSLIFIKKLEKYKLELLDPLFSAKEIRELKVKPFNDLKNSFQKIIILNNNKYFKTRTFQRKVLTLLKKDGEIYDYWDIFDKKLLKKDINYFHIGES